MDKGDSNSKKKHAMDRSIRKKARLLRDIRVPDAKLIFPRFRSLFLTFVNGVKPDRGCTLLCAPLRPELGRTFLRNSSFRALLAASVQGARILCDCDLCSNSNAHVARS